MKIRAWHPDSGSVMTAEVTAVSGSDPHRSFRVIPDGLLESVIQREGTWVVRLGGERLNTANPQDPGATLIACSECGGVVNPSDAASGCPLCLRCLNGPYT
jgi:hypothetical protein